MSSENTGKNPATEPLPSEKATRIPTLEEILRELDMEKYLVPDDVEGPLAFGGLHGGPSKKQ